MTVAGSKIQVLCEAPIGKTRKKLRVSLCGSVASCGAGNTRVCGRREDADNAGKMLAGANDVDASVARARVATRRAGAT